MSHKQSLSMDGAAMVHWLLWHLRVPTHLSSAWHVFLGVLGMDPSSP